MLNKAQGMDEWSHFLSDLDPRVVELVISSVPKSVVQGYSEIIHVENLLSKLENNNLLKRARVSSRTTDCSPSCQRSSLPGSDMGWSQFLRTLPILPEPGNEAGR